MRRVFAVLVAVFSTVSTAGYASRAPVPRMTGRPAGAAGSPRVGAKTTLGQSAADATSAKQERARKARLYRAFEGDSNLKDLKRRFDKSVAIIDAVVSGKLEFETRNSDRDTLVKRELGTWSSIDPILQNMRSFDKNAKAEIDRAKAAGLSRAKIRELKQGLAARRVSEVDSRFATYGITEAEALERESREVHHVPDVLWLKKGGPEHIYDHRANIAAPFKRYREAWLNDPSAASEWTRLEELRKDPEGLVKLLAFGVKQQWHLSGPAARPARNARERIDMNLFTDLLKLMIRCDSPEDPLKFLPLHNHWSGYHTDDIAAEVRGGDKTLKLALRDVQK